MGPADGTTVEALGRVACAVFQGPETDILYKNSSADEHLGLSSNIEIEVSFNVEFLSPV